MKRILLTLENRERRLGKILLSATVILSLLLTPVSILEAANGKQNKTNILCIWTDRQTLKAVTLMNFDSLSGRIGILSVPVFAHLETDGKQTTVGRVWIQEGRDGLKRRLENALQIQIDGHITFDQPVIEKASTVIGAINVKGGKPLYCRPLKIRGWSGVRTIRMSSGPWQPTSFPPVE
ncbi:hypothetical protein [Desulforamulus profundi]|uniref:hypothetical protein n=1 Tax=Desulforamulus profundi TaxID=1383067 RepID=UPI001EE5D1FC|nr:hypothetical protein [Desulforamulus profundi]